MFGSNEEPPHYNGLCKGMMAIGAEKFSNAYQNNTIFIFFLLQYKQDLFRTRWRLKE